MPTSGSVDFNANRNILIRGALRVIGVLSAGETPSAQEVVDASEALNMMIKAWVIDGKSLWLQREAILFCAKDTVFYPIPASQACGVDDLVSTTIATAGVLGDGALVVADASGISNGDRIGILLDDGTRQWTTVNGAPVVNTVTLTAVLTAAAAIGNTVYTYAPAADLTRPTRVRNMRLLRSDNTETLLTPYGMPLARADYLSINTKQTPGTPNSAYFDPQLSTGNIFLWPAPDTAKHRIVFTYDHAIEDFDTLTDDPDFPQEWLSALKFNLAVEIYPEYFPNKNPSDFLVAKALSLKDALLNWNTDPGSTYFEPEYE